MKAHDWEDMKEQTCRPVVLHCKVLMTVSDAGRLPLKPLSLVAVTVCCDPLGLLFYVYIETDCFHGLYFTHKC